MTASTILVTPMLLASSETKKTGPFTLPGIGKLVLVKRKARIGRNPATEAEIKRPAQGVVKTWKREGLGKRSDLKKG
jgi:nucleoid DNA-binding protein